MDYVIVGAGPAGVIAAETLAKTDSGSVTLVGSEPEPPGGFCIILRDAFSAVVHDPEVELSICISCFCQCP